MMTDNYWVIIPAGGVGTRMGSDCPKQYLSLQGKAILQHTLERLSLPWIAGVVVCISERDTNWIHLPWQAKFSKSPPFIQAPSGVERCHSVMNGLQQLQSYAHPQDWVLVHDAVRPCVRIADIEKLKLTLQQHPVGGLLAVPVRDTMKRADTQKNVVATVNRANLWHALTPQMFRFHLLVEALQKVLLTGDLVTDESQAVEQLGYQPLLVEGHADNIKITHPHDLTLAEWYLQQQATYAS